MHALKLDRLPEEKFMDTPQPAARQESAKPLATGTGYGRQGPSYDSELIEAGPGTPMGEMMRQYWFPVARSDEIEADGPQ